jgi:ubiquitin-protein ligase
MHTRLDLKGFGCQFQMEGNNCFIWRVTLKGPPETPYEG